MLYEDEDTCPRWCQPCTPWTPQTPRPPTTVSAPASRWCRPGPYTVCMYDVRMYHTYVCTYMLRPN